ncbi:hypothetical protein NEMBOFW57_001606 [Staphylotrichum longicolle]|uniref:Splicing factor subunit n=1 Tax=Staphylotrichum longicolle TaxID=669026 RepID=A0AAD4I0Z4_9PEZI|nr:hypothetical protein NEMBOFW57_001606 [Staphylotrichum longicolle]
MADKLRNQQELERLQAKYVGTGHPDTTSWEWKTNIHRDTYSSIAGHPPLLSYIALAENEPVAKVRVQMIRHGAEANRDKGGWKASGIRRQLAM